MHTLMTGDFAQPLAPPAASTPDDQSLYMRGLQALRIGDAEDAIALLTQALRRQPAHRGIRRNLVRALLVAEQFEQVVVQATAALSGQSTDAELHFARGTALNALGQHAKACAALGRALSLQPDHAPSWLNMGNASADLEDLASAEQLYRTAIGLDAGLAEAHASLGYILTMQGRLGEAIDACEAAIRLSPDFAQAHWNLAIAALLSGDLPRGFAEYEWRKRHTRYRAHFPEIAGRRWDGADVRGQTILVRAEQGFGDVIQFARYLPLIRDMGGNPIMVCAPSLVTLVQSMTGVRAASSSEPLPAYDAWIDQISLAKVFRTTLDTIPGDGPYLFAEPAQVLEWRARLRGPRFSEQLPNIKLRSEARPDEAQGGGRCVIGIAFTGNPKHPADKRRSIPADFDLKLPDIPGVSFVNLQHGISTTLLGLPDLSAWMLDYADTAALIDSLDLVITVDTSVAHLAGALGKPVWILLPHAPDWRWLLDRLDSPWYQSARLFRQTVPGDWASLLAQVMATLRHDHGARDIKV